MANTPKNNEVMKDLQGFFKEGEKERIYEACEYWRDRVLIRLLWKTGRRISEVLQIKVQDIDFENRNILWNILKKKEPLKRWKPIDDFTLDLLALYIKKSDLYLEDYLIHSGNPTKPMTRDGAFKLVRRTAKKAGINFVGGKRPHPHHFRHSFAIDLSKKLKSPSDVRKLQMIMEHSSLGMTEQYLQFGNMELRELIEE